MLRATAAAVRDLVFPPHCAACETSLETSGRQVLCEACFESLPLIEGGRCRRCGAPHGPYTNDTQDCLSCRGRRLAFERCVSACHYEGLAKQLILQIKMARLAAAIPLLAQLVLERLSQEAFLVEISIIVPVPSSLWAWMRRGFNQAEELARELARPLKRPLHPRALKRRLASDSQTRVSRETRWKNAEGSYYAGRTRRLQGKKVLLVDDVVTTGATASACARVLRRAGAAAVYVASVAR